MSAFFGSCRCITCSFIRRCPPHQSRERLCVIVLMIMCNMNRTRQTPILSPQHSAIRSILSLKARFLRMCGSLRPPQICNPAKREFDIESFTSTDYSCAIPIPDVAARVQFCRCTQKPSLQHNCNLPLSPNPKRRLTRCMPVW